VGTGCRVDGSGSRAEGSGLRVKGWGWRASMSTRGGRVLVYIQLIMPHFSFGRRSSAGTASS
jgi:hypothetical protein